LFHRSDIIGEFRSHGEVEGTYYTVSHKTEPLKFLQCLRFLLKHKKHTPEVPKYLLRKIQPNLDLVAVLRPNCIRPTDER